jgi:hypothetical protein
MKASVRLLFALCCLLCLSENTGAQGSSLVTFTSDRNSDNSISIYADSRIYGEYTLKIIFTALEGYRATGVNVYKDIALGTITRGKREVAKLVPERSATHFSASYRFTYFPGTALNRPPDSSFLYLLPGGTDKTVQISKVFNIEEKLGRVIQTDFSATGFIYHLGDTVCATRGGIVYDCIDSTKEGEKGNEVFRGDRNRISIQHKDGTLGNYVFRAPVKLLIAAGDEVVPGQPVAIFSKISEHYTLMFSVFYQDQKKILTMPDNGDNVQNVSHVSFLHPLFCNDFSGTTNTLLQISNNYVVTHPAKIIGAEMTKKEKKKFGLL